MPLGVPRDSVILVPHDARWAIEYQKAAQALTRILGDNVVAMQHVGSTAIKSISAKPILDIAIRIRCLDALCVDSMEAAGYDYCGDRAVPGDYLFVKRRYGEISTHHIHCYVDGNADYEAKLRFRDYLNTHPAQAQAYGVLKEQLAAQYPKDRNAYTQGKTEFIEKILAMAKKG